MNLRSCADNLSHRSRIYTRIPHTPKIALIELLTSRNLPFLAVPAFSAVRKGEKDRVAFLDGLDG